MDRVLREQRMPYRWGCRCWICFGSNAAFSRGQNGLLPRISTLEVIQYWGFGSVKCQSQDLQSPLSFFHSERRVVQPEEYSAKTAELRNLYGYKTPPTSKLITDLNVKKKYKIHYENLKEVLALGVELVEIHSAVKFRQKPWLGEYIKHNNDRRKLATSSSEKDFWKLLNNS